MSASTGMNNQVRSVRGRAATGGLMLLMAIGCGTDRPMTSVKGKILYNGKPLAFGFVMFHPRNGQVAQAAIESDGTFNLSTYRANDGVVPGTYRVSVVCYEAHDPNGPAPRADEGGAMMLGASLIPLKYTRASSSGLVANISDHGNKEIALELHGPPLR